MSFQAVRAVFEAPVIAALAGLSTPVPCYVDNQAFTVPDAGQEYATINLQFGQTTSKVLTGNLERLRGSLVVECYTSKNTGPARAQEMITPVMQALNDLNSCSGYKATGAVGWVGDMTGPAFFALDDAPFYMVRVSVAVTAKYSGMLTGLRISRARSVTYSRPKNARTSFVFQNHACRLRQYGADRRLRVSCVHPCGHHCVSAGPHRLPDC